MDTSVNTVASATPLNFAEFTCLVARLAELVAQGALCHSAVTAVQESAVASGFYTPWTSYLVRTAKVHLAGDPADAAAKAIIWMKVPDQADPKLVAEALKPLCAAMQGNSGPAR